MKGKVQPNKEGEDGRRHNNVEFLLTTKSTLGVVQQKTLVEKNEYWTCVDMKSKTMVAYISYHENRQNEKLWNRMGWLALVTHLLMSSDTDRTPIGSWIC